MKEEFNVRNKLLSIVSILLLLTLLFGCNTEASPVGITIKGPEQIEMTVGNTLQLELEESTASVVWTVSGSSVTVDENGLVTARSTGRSVVTAKSNGPWDAVVIEVKSASDKPVLNDGGNPPAQSYEEALARSENGILSGYTTVPDQAPTISEYRPMKDGKYILNTNFNFADENTYVVVDAYGNEVLRVYRGGAYITLEEVAAYIYAFGDIPANYTSSKKTKPQNSIWGENLRVNHTKFSGSTKKYPYEPELPNITGCGGSLQYYELDIGTTGTDCDPSYRAKIYNDGKTITRGAARIVYGKRDINGNGIYEYGELHLFYTYNHYNDFQEYLNYYGGWGEMFGNITGGGSLSSKHNYNPTPYVEVIREELPGNTSRTTVYYCIPNKFWLYAA